MVSSWLRFHPPDPPSPTARSLTIGRLHYDGGGDWYAGPSSLPNMLAAIRQRTTLQVAERERVVTLRSADLWDVPYLFMRGHGNVHFSDDEVVVLRRYLEQGGFLHADDDYGMDASFRREIQRVFPDHPLVEVPLTHAVYHLVYDFPRGLPKIHEHDGLPAQGFGIFWGTGSPYTIRISRIWATGGKTPKCTTIPRSSTRRRCAWASISSHMR